MRLKKHICLIVYAAIFMLIGLGTVIFHYCLKPEHSVICHFINAGQLATLGLGGFYLFRGYQKKDKNLLKGFILACAICVVAMLIYCVEISKTYNLFGKCAIMAGATDIAVLSALFFGKNSPKKRSLIFCFYTLGSTFALTVAYLILAWEPIFVDGNVSNITTLLDLVNCLSFAGILTISESLKFKDKEEQSK